MHHKRKLSYPPVISAVASAEEIPAKREEPTPGLEPGTPSLRGKDK
jgi:hypothetical protein